MYKRQIENRLPAVTIGSQSTSAHFLSVLYRVWRPNRATGIIVARPHADLPALPTQHNYRIAVYPASLAGNVISGNPDHVLDFVEETYPGTHTLGGIAKSDKTKVRTVLTEETDPITESAITFNRRTAGQDVYIYSCLLYTSPSPRD